MYKRICKRITRRSKRFKKITAIILIFFILSFIYLIYICTCNSALIKSIEVNSVSLVTKAVNSAITDILGSSIVYDKLVTITRDNDMNIVMVQADSYEINVLSRQFAQATEAKIKDFGTEGIRIALGTFSGINILVGRGPEINVMISPIGSVSCVFLTQFASAGINQTNQKIILQINVDVGVVLPVTTHNFSTQQEVLLSQTILIGKVPQFYLNYSKPSPLLNLTP